MHLRNFWVKLWGVQFDNRSDPTTALNDTRIRTAKPLSKSYKLSDTQGLYLTVTAKGSRRWYFRFCFNGKESRLALGACPQVSLVQAREKRDVARNLLASGNQPCSVTPAETASR